MGGRGKSPSGEAGGQGKHAQQNQAPLGKGSGGGGGTSVSGNVSRLPGIGGGNKRV